MEEEAWEELDRKQQYNAPDERVSKKEFEQNYDRWMLHDYVTKIMNPLKTFKMKSITNIYQQ